VVVGALEKCSEALREASRCLSGEIGGRRRIFLGYYDLRGNHHRLHYDFHR
jgi:hypothetical protein